MGIQKNHILVWMSCLTILFVALFVMAGQPVLGEGPPVYSEIQNDIGITHTHALGAICDDPTPVGGRPPIGSGSAWADYDNDGDPDLFVTNHGGADWLYRNEGDTGGTSLPDFVDVASTAGVDAPLDTSFGAVFIDYDNDGDQDLYVTKFNGNSLYQNQLVETGTANFTDVTGAAGVANSGRAITAAWGDYDQDGYLDFYLAKHRQCPAPDENPEDALYHNNGDGTFSEVTGILCPGGIAPCAQTSGLGFTAGWVDYDNDGDSDLYLINDNIDDLYQPNVLWRNDGGGTFTDVSAASGTDTSLNGMGLGVGDYDNDGYMDFAFSNIAPGVLLHNEGDGTFTDVSVSSGVSATLDVGTWGTAFWDYDNNGLLDLFFVGGNVGSAAPVEDRFLTNDGDGTFTDFSFGSGLDHTGRGRSASIVDFDQDGFVEVFVGHYGQTPAIFRNDSADQGNSNHWLTITVEGTHSNRDGIGTRLYLTTADGVTQMRDITSGATHGGGDFRAAYFGLSTYMTGTLEIRWPSGLVSDLGEINADQTLHYVEPTVYSDVTTQVGINHIHTRGPICDDPTPVGGRPPIGSGSAWADYDGDGDPDLFVTNHGGADWLYRNDGDTNMDSLPDFTDVAVTAGVDAPADTSFGAVFIDYDNDGDQDLYVTKFNGNSLYENQLVETGTANFTDVTGAAGVANAGRAITSAWADYDQDGYLDLYLAKHRQCPPPDENPEDALYHNNGDGTFTDVTGILCPGGIAPCTQTSGLGFTAGWVDYDNDADLDLYLINDDINGAYTPNVLWRNDGGGTFTDVSVASGTDTSLNGMGLGVGDYDNDGYMDFAFSNVAPGVLLHNEGDGTFTDVSASSGVSDTTDVGTWGTAFWDYDNNGLLDLYFVGGNIGNADPVPDKFMSNNGDGTFADFSVGSGLDHPGRGRSASMVDFDQDGFVEVFVGNYGQAPGLFRNDSADLGNNNQWLSITVEGTASNRDGIGTRLYLTTADGTTQMRDITSGATHGGGDYRAAYFGLSSHMTGTLSIRWPSGIISNIGTLSGNQMQHYIEPNASDIILDDDFSDWGDGDGNEICFADEGGDSDYAGLDRFEITQYCLATNQISDLQLLIGFDRISGDGTTTACALFDTDPIPNFSFDRALCVTLDGSDPLEFGPLLVDNVSLYSCDDTTSFTGCVSPALLQTYTSTSYGFSNLTPGPFGGNDSMIEIQLPFTDLGITACDSVYTTLFSFTDQASLDTILDSIFGTTEQSTVRRLQFNSCDASWSFNDPTAISFTSSSVGTTTISVGFTVILLMLIGLTVALLRFYRGDELAQNAGKVR